MLQEPRTHIVKFFSLSSGLFPWPLHSERTEFGVFHTEAMSRLFEAWWPEAFRFSLSHYGFDFLCIPQLQCTTLSCIWPPPEMQFCHIGSSQRYYVAAGYLTTMPPWQVCRRADGAKPSLYSPRHTRHIPMWTRYVYARRPRMYDLWTNNVKCKHRSWRSYSRRKKLMQINFQLLRHRQPFCFLFS